VTRSDALLPGPDEAVTEMRYPLKAPRRAFSGEQQAKTMLFACGRRATK
jgi:hypothetical protein